MSVTKRQQVRLMYRTSKQRWNFFTPSWLVASCSKYEGASHAKLTASVALVSSRWWPCRPWLRHLLRTLLQFQSASRGFGQNEDLLGLGFREIFVIGLPIQLLLLECRQIRARFVLACFRTPTTSPFCKNLSLVIPITNKAIASVHNAPQGGN